MSHTSSNPLTRREALCRIGNGFGMLAFAGMVGESLEIASALAAQDPASPRRSPGEGGLNGGLQHVARAKHVIFLFMNGGLSQVDSFDPKPMLDKFHGQPLPGDPVA